MKQIKILLTTLLLSVAGVVWAGPVNVNTADAETLSAELDGVGEAIAKRIIEEREKNGDFKDDGDLQQRVKGIGDKTVEKNKANLKFSDE